MKVQNNIAGSADEVTKHLLYFLNQINVFCSSSLFRSNFEVDIF
jgi:hypothetical protein